MSRTQRNRPLESRSAPFVVVTGFMGTGKSETGRVLAQLLGVEFVDTDSLIEEREGTTIAEIFERRGERHFRLLEEKVCEELALRSGIVVATGGGTLVNEANLEALSRRGEVVLLEASVDAILARVRRGATRPLLCGLDSACPTQAGVQDDALLRGTILRILEARESAYHRIRLRVDTTSATPLEAAHRIVPLLDIPHRAITTRAPATPPELGPEPVLGRDDAHAGPARIADRTRGPHATRIEIGRGLLSKLGSRLRSLGLDSRVFLLMPGNVRALFAEQISASLDSDSIPWTHLPVRDGDSEKTLEQAGELLAELASQGAERNSVAVAVGGGVTGDLAGFAASVYMRGIPLVHVPTTLLSQVDSSIGGKVGVNHGGAKNLVGSFYQPHLVLSDPCTLRTLPDTEIANGMAEVVKTAIIGSSALYEFIESELSESSPRLGLRDIAFLERCVAECAAVKAAVVERDPFERGERRILNLGHTLGHALEAAGGFSGLTHGEAVSVGLVAALTIAEDRGLVDGDLLRRTEAMLKRYGLPVTAPSFDESALMASLHLDKKKRSGRLRFVLPVRLGSAEVFDDVAEGEMLAAIRKGER